jgi:hypothetical protein
VNEAAWNSEEFNQSQSVRKPESAARPSSYSRGRSTAPKKSRPAPTNPSQNRTMEKLVKQNETIIDLLRDIKNGLNPSSSSNKAPASSSKPKRPAKPFTSRPTSAPEKPVVEKSENSSTETPTSEPQKNEGAAARRPKKAFVFRADGKKPNLEVNTEAPKVETPKSEAPKTEAPKKEEVKVEAANQSPKVENTEIDGNSANVVETEAPVSDGNSVEAVDLHAENSEGEDNPFGQFGRR